MLIEDKLIRELTEKSQIELTDQVVIEDMDGTKLGSVRSLRSLMMNNFIFNNVEDMKCAQLRENDICITLGYHTVGDGGAATYRIVYEPTAIDDRANYHYLHSSDVYRAKFISEDGTVLPEQFGAYGDGDHDDIDAITKCINSKFTIRFSGKGKYKITKAIPIKSNLTLDFNGSTIVPSRCAVFYKWVITEGDNVITDNISNLIIRNGIFDHENANTITLRANFHNVVIENIDIINGTSMNTNIYNPDGFTIRNYTCDKGDGIRFWCDNIYPAKPARPLSVNIENCRIDNYSGAGIYIGTYADSWSINISNISSKNSSNTSGNLIWIAGGNEMYNASIKNIRSINAPVPVMVTLGGNTTVDIQNIHATNAWCGVWFDGMDKNGDVSLGGYLLLDGENNLSDKYPIIYGRKSKLHLNTTSINYNPETYTESSDIVSMTVYDNASPYSYPIKSMSVSGNELTIPFFRNGIIEITNTGSDITELIDGVENQVIGLKATSTRKIANSGSISLHSAPDATALTNNKIIYLKCISGRWTEL